MAQPKVGKFLHRPCFLHCLFHIDRKPDSVVEPASDFCVVRPVRYTGGALQHVAVPRAKLRLFHPRLAGPEILWLQKILIAESTAERAVAPLVERQYSRLLVAWMRDPDRGLPSRTHFEQYMFTCTGRRGNIHQHPQDAGKPVRIDGEAIADSRAVCVHPDQVTAGAKIRRLNALSRSR